MRSRRILRSFVALRRLRMTRGRLARGIERVLEYLLVDGLVVGGAGADLPFVEQPLDRRVHVDHPFLDARLDRRGDLPRFALADHVADRGRGEEDLQRGDAATLELREELLRDDGADRVAEDVADPLLLAGREDVDDAVHRLG